MAKGFEAAIKRQLGLRSSGITVPLADALIAVIAQRYQVKKLTIDKHFHHLAVKLYD